MKIYFIGIGGIGMSALARTYKAKGWDVAGSDAVPSMLIATLRKEGIHVDIGHKKENIKPNVGLVVYNRAIHPDNPEIRAARKLRIRDAPLRRSFGKVTKEYMSVAITGSHGKSTTTALAALTLIAGGYDPTVLIGTTLKEFGGKNVRVGRGDALVLEADDFGAAFTAYSPTVAIVTNIDREHLDFYKSFTNVKAAFIKFLSHVRPGGLMILNRDDLPLWGLRNRIREVAKKNSVTTVWYSLHGPAMKKIKKVIRNSRHSQRLKRHGGKPPRCVSRDSRKESSRRDPWLSRRVAKDGAPRNIQRSAGL